MNVAVVDIGCRTFFVTYRSRTGDRLTTLPVVCLVCPLTPDQPSASASDGAPGNVVALYRKYRTKTMGVIGYKGGHVEKDLLQRLGIPSVNLEEFGCPKFEHLMVPDFNPVEGCGFHVRQSHCAMVKCDHAHANVNVVT